MQHSTKPGTAIPSLSVSDAAGAIELYKKALGAKEEARMEVPGSKKIMHAILTIGGSPFFIADADLCPNGKESTSGFYLYVEDVDASFKKAKDAGFTTMMEDGPQDMFWGDRVGGVKDMYGNSWTFATHKRDVSGPQMEKERDAFMKQMAQKAGPKAA